MYLSSQTFPVKEYALSGGNKGTRETMNFMRDLIRAGRKHPPGPGGATVFASG